MRASAWLGLTIVALCACSRAASAQDEGYTPSHVIEDTRMPDGVDISLTYGSMTGLACEGSAWTAAGPALVGWRAGFPTPFWGGAGLKALTDQQRSEMDAGIHGCDITRQQIRMGLRQP